MTDSIIGTEVDGYRIQEVLGRGGMGVVYKAEDINLSRTVAIKRINPQLANDEAFLRRFRSEARALARIDSSYIVSVYALRQTDAGLLIVMEYVDGGTLKDLILEGPMDWSQAMPLIKQMLTALDHAHGAGVIHRDIKPHNIMLSESGTVKVTDFGLAKVHRGDDQRTVTQGVYGTLNYMSPEQVQGGANLDHRSDLYSLGMTIYEMLAGGLPFDEDSSEFSKMRMIVEEELPRPDQLRPQIPDALSQLVMKALEKKPDDRFQSAEDMRAAFEAFEAKHGGGDAAPPQPDKKKQPAADSGSGRRWGLIGGLAALIVLLGVGGYVLFGQEAANDPSESAASETEERPSRTTQLSISTDPVGADVFSGETLLGVTPLERAVEGDSVTLRVQRPGYVPVDTTLRLADATEASLALSLTEEDSDQSVATTDPSAQNGDSEPSSAEEAATDEESAAEQTEPSSPARGTLTLSASPEGTVYVDGEARGSGGSIRVPAGTHQISFRHPQYGRKDTTLTVSEGQTQELTCYFTHRVDVRSEPWANVYIDGENTEEATPYNTELGAGTSYRIEVHIQRGSYRVTGGEYRWRVGDRRSQRDFSGEAITITLEPSFEETAHVIDFQIAESSS